MLSITTCATLISMQIPIYPNCSPWKKQMHRKTRKSKMFGCVLACNPIPREYGQWAGDHSWSDEAGGKEIDEFRGKEIMHFKKMHTLSCKWKIKNCFLKAYSHCPNILICNCHSMSTLSLTVVLSCIVWRGENVWSTTSRCKMYVDFVIRRYGKQQLSLTDTPRPFWQRC